MAVKMIYNLGIGQERKIFVSMAMVKAQVSSGSIPEDVIDNDIDPELTEEQAHQVGR